MATSIKPFHSNPGYVMLCCTRVFGLGSVWVCATEEPQMEIGFQAKQGLGPRLFNRLRGLRVALPREQIFGSIKQAYHT